MQILKNCIATCILICSLSVLAAFIVLLVPAIFWGYNWDVSGPWVYLYALIWILVSVVFSFFLIPLLALRLPKQTANFLSIGSAVIIVGLILDLASGSLEVLSLARVALLFWVLLATAFTVNWVYKVWQSPVQHGLVLTDARVYRLSWWRPLLLFVLALIALLPLPLWTGVSEIPPALQIFFFCLFVPAALLATHAITAYFRDDYTLTVSKEGLLVGAAISSQLHNHGHIPWSELRSIRSLRQGDPAGIRPVWLLSIVPKDSSALVTYARKSWFTKSLYIVLHITYLNTFPQQLQSELDSRMKSAVE